MPGATRCRYGRATGGWRNAPRSWVGRYTQRISSSGPSDSGSSCALGSAESNPSLDETHVCLLLERKDLSGTLLEEIAKRKTWRASYRVRRALAAHPHTPRLVAMRLMRDLHLMDLVRISLQTASPVELRRLAEDRVLAQLPQLPLGQRIMLARRGSARRRLPTPTAMGSERAHG